MIQVSRIVYKFTTMSTILVECVDKFPCIYNINAKEYSIRDVEKYLRRYSVTPNQILFKILSIWKLRTYFSIDRFLSHTIQYSSKTRMCIPRPIYWKICTLVLA